MPALSISKSTTITINRGSVPVRDLIDALNGLPDDATVSITEYKGDQRDPGYVTITVRES